MFFFLACNAKPEPVRRENARKGSVVNVNPTNIRPQSDSPEIRKYKKKFNSEVLCAALWGKLSSIWACVWREASRRRGWQNTRGRFRSCIAPLLSESPRVDHWVDTCVTRMTLPPWWKMANRWLTVARSFVHQNEKMFWLSTKLKLCLLEEPKVANVLVTYAARANYSCLSCVRAQLITLSADSVETIQNWRLLLSCVLGILRIWSSRSGVSLSKSLAS